MPSYKYGKDTPAADIIEKFKELLPDDGKCDRAEVLDFHAPTVSSNGTALQMAHAITKEKWVYWDLVVLGEDTDPVVRKVLIAKIKDPMRAFILYLNLAWLSATEDKMLIAKFKNRLPTAEQELAEGIVVRAKNG